MIGWWSHFDDPRIASVRIRGELVMRALRAHNINVRWFNPDRPQVFDTVVIGKRHDPATLDTTRAFQANGGRVVVDLCDNRLTCPASDPKRRDEAQQLKQLLSFADQVVVSTPELARITREECPQLKHLSVIGDLADDLSVVTLSPLQRIGGMMNLWRSIARIHALRSTGHTMVVWFGNHGGTYAEAGMNDLLRLRDLLEAIHRSTPIALTVISNHFEKYQQNIAPFLIPTLYSEWHPATFERLLQAHDISIIPITDNTFTRCKTDNRVVTSLVNGLAVIADPIPSYLPYADVIALDHWEESLTRYVKDSAARKRDVIAGQALAKRMTDTETIARQWRQVLERPGATSNESLVL